MEKLEIYSVKDVVRNYPFNEIQLRKLLLKRKSNGLDKAVIKINRLLYFKKDLLEEWILSHLEA